MDCLNQYQGKNFYLLNGDTTELIRNFPDNSMHFEIYSPPFSSLYTYSNSDRDLGNSKNDEEFFAHFHFITSELFRILKPGRIMAVHCMNLPTSKERDGFIGIKDFRGDLIREFQSAGFMLHEIEQQFICLLRRQVGRCGFPFVERIGLYASCGGNGFDGVTLHVDCG